ncbi:hypothetical protein [Empedobacter brevis]|uniref:hypothetical protein n=1 Tax=Empedobacter brevis TaxID=247 RepID=UPI00289F1A84|nr:hypothetical protein [Empedobacter brevis]
MDILQQLQHFTKGELIQGKWMIGIAIIVLLPLVFFLFKSNLSLQKGMAIPVGLLMAISIVYGSYVLYSKPKYLTETEKEIQLNPKEKLDSELQKVKTDDKSYTTLKYVWGTCVIVSIVLYFVVGKDFHKGLSLGFAILFLSFLIIDSFFHQRLNSYLEELNKLTI